MLVPVVPGQHLVLQEVRSQEVAVVAVERMALVAVEPEYPVLVGQVVVVEVECLVLLGITEQLILVEVGVEERPQPVLDAMAVRVLSLSVININRMVK
jgi:hypothetical protein